MWQQLGKARDPETWEMYPSQVNAYFNPPANEVGIAYCPILLLLRLTRVVDRVPCWYSSAAILLTKLVSMGML